jgi:raffinose/stachyose/melibiose transport system substrate-binding protein
VDPKWAEKRANHQVTFESSPLWRRALQSIVDMKDADCFNPGVQGTARPQQYVILARGDAVMSIMSASELPNIITINPNFHYAMMNLPPDNPKNSVAVASVTNVIAGNAATKYPNEVRTFIDFMAREQQSSLLAKIGGEIAPLDAKKGKIPAYMKAGMGQMFASGKIADTGEFGWPNVRIRDEGYVPGILGLFTGQTTVDGILRKMDQLWDNPS